MGKPAEVRSIAAQGDKPQRVKDNQTIAVAEEFNRTGFSKNNSSKR